MCYCRYPHKTHTHTLFDLLFFYNLFVTHVFWFLDVHEMDPITKTLRLTSMQIQDLIWFYKYARSQFDSPPEYETIAGDRVPSVQRLTWVLMTTEREINRIIKLAKIVDDYAKNLESKSHGKVTFKDDTNNFMGFLSCFEIGVTGLIGLHRDLSDDKKQEIGEIFIHFASVSLNLMSN